MSCPICANFKGYCDYNDWQAEAPAREARGYKRVTHNEVYCSDVDDTLVMWDLENAFGLEVEVKCPYSESDQHFYLVRNEPMIEMLKTKHARGCYIIVWSQGGEAWADAVVKALGIEQYVHQTMSKPSSYGDDLPASEWMHGRVYLKPDHKWRNND